MILMVGFKLEAIESVLTVSWSAVNVTHFEIPDFDAANTIYSIFPDRCITKPVEPLSEDNAHEDATYSDEEQKEIEERLLSSGYNRIS